MRTRLVLAGILALQATAALAVTDAERVAVYKDFRTKYDARQYAEAQPFAEKLVVLTEQQYGPEELPLTDPLTNLATVQFKQGNFAQAIENYRRSLNILQAKSTIADKAQIRPLHGLGISLLGARDPEQAVIALKRAADLSRNTDGLFNIGQIEFIDPLIDAYAATGRWPEADKESAYALRVEEAAYGRNSPKLLDRLDKLARWYEAQRRYTSERAVYERSLTILGRSGPVNDMRRVEPLRGIARSFRLESFYGIEGADNAGTFNAGPTGAGVFNDGTSQRRGESALTTALAVVDGNSPVNHATRGAVLADLGDWFLTNNSLRRAYENYAEAWKALALAGDTSPLEKPRPLAVRPSISSVERSQIEPADAEVKVVEMHFTVDRDGRVDNVTSPTTDVSEAIVRNAIASMKRARFAPRIENGAAVPTENAVYLERVLVKVTSTESAPAASPETSAEKAPEPATPSQDSPDPK
jgi:tetratricopeptide (TPR) repeat protein